MNVLFTICGRAGSKGFKNKNLKELQGVPLVYYTLAAIKDYIKRHSENTVKVALNTDSVPLIDVVMKQNKVQVDLIERKPELAGDVVPKVDVIKDTFLNYKDDNIDVIVDLDITSPMRTVKDIESVLEIYNSDTYDLVFSVVEARRSPYFNMVEKKDDGFFKKICMSGFTARQQAPKSYEMNASIYAYNPLFLESNITKTILDYRCGISIMPDYLVLDIDSEEDFAMMQYLFKYYCNKDEDLMSVSKTAKEMI